MKKILLAICAVLACASVQAQSVKRLSEQQQKAATSSGVTLTQRAKSQYTAQTATPTEVSWKRDIYRELDLKKEKNAALYYPEEPLGDRVNFFTLLFKLVLEGKVSAYEYRLDGNELFTADNKLDIENLLDKFYIYYEKKDGKYVVQQTDIPSSEVLKYYIKESNYLDQRTSNYFTRVTAVCPVLMRSDFGAGYTSYPMFWLNYDEISPYLGQSQVMTSSYNNTSNMSLDDYFVMHQYEGTIYKTSNLMNRPLAEYCENDSALLMEQQRIERQLTDFEEGLWTTEKPQATEEGGNEAQPDKASKKASKEKEKSAKRQSSKDGKSEKAAKPVRQTGTKEHVSVNRGR